ncbi:hypothetical protein [Plantactinospora soyae]|uniref:Outer membrane murein-binding lipoprotein Lpp n=1 Tax=Plantactinospora soyae TaxID=1544732 RepID=A0A927M2Z8_9ACTN|nr:hypothetical protein [Plantactinospora soyae]MBE1485870.1 outer membrane murein-binding lipoprotein Lpp [Plantactinospora soyae]
MARSPSQGRVVRRRLLVIVSSYLLAVLVAGLVLRAGISAGHTGADPIGVPWMVVGLGGVLGGALVAAAALYARRRLHPGRPDPLPLARAVVLARIGRILMLAAAVVAAVLGVLLAPAGEERAFAIATSTGLAALLAVFALLANDLTQLRQQVKSGRS